MNPRFWGSIAPLAILTLSLAAPACESPPLPIPVAPPDLDARVERAMKSFEVPGMAIAIVKDGRVLLARGYGVRRLGKPEPVDGKTLFAIASNTKVFTAAALGLLVEEDRIEWDAQVIRYVPWFQMWDPHVTRELTVRDLLVHRSGLGLGAGDLLWWPPSTLDRKEIARRLRYIPPATSFRSAYAYDNVLYLVAGEVIEAASGKTWEDFVASRILETVGMASSNVRFPATEDGRNLAAGHAEIEGVVREVRPFASDNTNPAGGIVSCAEDMARWMRVLLDEGRLADGSSLFSRETARQLTSLVTPIPIVDPEPELAGLKPNFLGYALGLGVRDFRGKKILSHTGALPGYGSRVTLVPELKFGIAVLTNQEATESYNAIVWGVLDAYLGAPAAIDWIEAYEKVRKRGRERVAESRRKAEELRDAASKPSLGLEKYAGTYTDDWYGDIEIAEDRGRLRMSFTRTPSLVGDLEHWQHDTFIVRWRDRELRADAYVSFALTPEGTVESGTMRAVSPDTDFSFDFHDLRLKPARGRRPR